MTVEAIVLHHAAAPRSTTVEQIREWHKAKGWRDIGYHWLILDEPGSPFGAQMHIGRPHNLDDIWEPWEYGAHAVGHNSRSISICLVGNFSEEEPSPTVLDLLHGWLAALCVTLKLDADAVVGHRELPGAATECPGLLVDMDKIRARLRDALHGET